MDILRSLIDEAELAQEADKACILELSHEFTFQPVDSAAENTVSITNCIFPDQYPYSLLRFVQLGQKAAADHVEELSNVLHMYGN